MEDSFDEASSLNRLASHKQIHFAMATWRLATLENVLAGVFLQPVVSLRYLGFGSDGTLAFRSIRRDGNLGLTDFLLLFGQ